eukprot:13143-Chlamydomonas_euryale.AAC.1
MCVRLHVNVGLAHWGGSTRADTLERAVDDPWKDKEGDSWKDTPPRPPTIAPHTIAMHAVPSAAGVSLYPSVQTWAPALPSCAFLPFPS